MQESFCLHCGEAFVKKVNSQKFCSPECRKRADKKRNPRRRIVVCKICGQEFLFRGNGTPPSRCKPCRDAWREANAKRKAEEEAAREARETFRTAWKESCEWRSIAEYPSYEVNAEGRVRNAENGNIIAVRERNGHRFSRVGGRNGQNIAVSTLVQAFIDGSIAKAQETLGGARQAAGNRPHWDAKYAATDSAILELWNSGYNAKQIREELNIGENTVFRHLRAAGLSAQKRIRNKEAEARAEKELERLKARVFRDMKGEQLEMYPRTCIVCGRPIQRGHKCPECTGYIPKRRQVLVCSSCGSEYQYSKEEGSSFKRCASCEAEHRREVNRQENRRYGQTLNARGRHWTRLTGADYEPINPAKVFRRDGNRCYLCGCELSERDGVIRGNYPTVDHVMPLSRGGAHTYANVKACCHTCNSHKGAATPEEVMGCA